MTADNDKQCLNVCSILSPPPTRLPSPFLFILTHPAVSSPILVLSLHSSLDPVVVITFIHIHWLPLCEWHSYIDFRQGGHDLSHVDVSDSNPISS